MTATSTDRSRVYRRLERSRTALIHADRALPARVAADPYRSFSSGVTRICTCSDDGLSTGGRPLGRLAGFMGMIVVYTNKHCNLSGAVV